VTVASGLYQGDPLFETPVKALLVFAMDSTP